jgi:hypothetical protein
MKMKRIYIMILLLALLLQGCSQKIEIKDTENDPIVKEKSVEKVFEVKPFKVIIRGNSLERIKTASDTIKANELWLLYEDGTEEMILKAGEKINEDLYIGTIINGFPSNDNRKIYFTSVRGPGEENNVFSYDLEERQLKFLTKGSIYNISKDDNIIINRQDENTWLKTYLIDEEGNEIREYSIKGENEEGLRNINYDELLNYLGRDIEYVYEDYGRVYSPNDFTEIAPFISIDKDSYRIVFHTSFDSSRVSEITLEKGYYTDAFPQVSILGIKLGESFDDISLSLGQGEIVTKRAEEVFYEEIQYPYKGYRLAIIDSENYDMAPGKVAGLRVYLGKEMEEFIEKEDNNSLLDQEILDISYDIFRGLDLYEKNEEVMDGNEDDFTIWLIGALGKFPIRERYIANEGESEFFESLEYEKVFDKIYVERFVNLVFDKDIKMTSDFYTPYFGDFKDISGKIVKLENKSGIYDSELIMYGSGDLKMGKMKIKMMKKDGIIKIISMDYKAFQ